MKKLIFVAVLYAILGCAKDPVSDNPGNPNIPTNPIDTTGNSKWTKLTNFAGSERGSSFAYVFNNKILVGGQDRYGNSNIFEYSIEEKKWTFKTNIPTISNKYNSANVDDKIYVFPEKLYISSPLPIDSIYKYEIEFNKWELIKLPEPITVARVLFSLKNKIYFWGYRSGDYEQNIFEFDVVLNSFKIVSRPYSAVGYALSEVSFASDNKGYICNDNLFEYDPETDNWIAKAQYPTGNAAGIGFFANDNVYVGLGIGKGKGIEKDIYVYSFTNNLWNPLTKYPGTGTCYNFCVTHNGIVYIGLGGPWGGFSTQYQTSGNNVEVYQFKL